MQLLNEIQFDRLISKFDKLKSTKQITKKISLHYINKYSNNFVSNFNFQKNFGEYKSNFINFLKIKNINLGFNEKILLEHYNKTFRYKNKSLLNVNHYCYFIKHFFNNNYHSWCNTYSLK